MGAVIRISDWTAGHAGPVSPVLQWSRAFEHASRQWAEVFYYSAFTIPRLWYFGAIWGYR